ncbi:Formylglycine-generating enzyme, required for sulfatase activity, contains SUMF1/FGE domain [Salegentibacter agarivorans]|uniref:Formylglycine-generating enzyme, required for sulfatase activity, contains SUMF1/FGE domain n=1 Tax=Salegentibacter agarivorans TaxID=345907 RepID=A0A1I2K0E1_9FLAO|nr:formylglycine-generating enzyme family protein [Salegentibacter agarivorans]SFF59660.1 Formylglycine-generating enzyme, required for sulfatase activity, contains SUMF1/FGE domain [Salegentibacter agarivorans]
MRLFFIKYFVLLCLFCSFLSCKNEENEPAEASKENIQKTEKSYHEKYLEEIAEIKERDSVSTSGMLKIEGGEYMMGGNSQQARRDEFPQHKEKIETIWVDETEVTNAEFGEFVEETGYVTTAERSFEINGKTFPPGAMVFDAENPQAWWKFKEGANWKHPQGPESSIEDKENHPVVQVSWYDAMAYAKWAGKRLPTEAEFEYLARGGKENQIYHWGNDFEKATAFVNFHQGDFPVSNEIKDSFEKTAPVKSFPPNSFGLYEISGNAWEWVLDTYYPNAYSKLEQRTDGYFKEYFNPQQQKVIRGGSFLCSESYCTGYRNAARMSSTPESGLEHLGFRCVKDVE